MLLDLVKRWKKESAPADTMRMWLQKLTFDIQGEQTLLLHFFYVLQFILNSTDGSRMYIAGKLSMPGLYENLSTNSIRNDEKDRPGSTVAFLTSRPT